MEKVLLLRYGEIHLKGKNRGFFDNQLIKNILQTANKIDENAKIKKVGGRYLLCNFSEENLLALSTEVSKVFRACFAFNCNFCFFKSRKN